MNFPTLETERLTLRPPTMDDVEWFYSVRSDAEFMAFMHRPPISQKSEAQDFIQNILDRVEQQTGIQWVLEVKASGKVVGYAGLWRWDQKNHTGELGYGLHPEDSGKGYMKEAVQKCIEFGFEKMQLERIEAWMDPENLGSRKVVESNGLQLEGTLRHSAFHNEKYFDLHVFSILRNER